MIYTNFLYFICAIFLYVYAPTGPVPVTFFNLVITFLLLMLFVQFNRMRFSKLRNEYDSRERSPAWLKRENNRYIFYHSVIAILVFGLELYSFHLKKLFTLVPGLGRLETFVDIAGVVVFLLHLGVIWYSSARILGDQLPELSPPLRYVSANFKFNLVIVIPWILFTFFQEVLSLTLPRLLARVWESTLANFLLLFLFLILIVLFAPVFITLLWDCRPLEDRELRQRIEKFLADQRVRFGRILSWKALNNSLVTAAVVGIIYPFRLLLITPRLMHLLDREEIFAVVAHEIGHVKKKHMFYYILFFFVFFVLSYGILNFTLYQLLLIFRGQIDFTVLKFFIIAFSILLFVLFFRYVFAFFIRNFERQADLYCFEAGVEVNLLISAFEKLQRVTRESPRKKNWHHFNIFQRIDFLQRARKDPDLIRKHRSMLHKRIGFFLLSSVLLLALTAGYYSSRTDRMLSVGAIARQLEKEPQNQELNRVLGSYYHELKNWEQAVRHYNRSLMADYDQPVVLNNLAWLYLTCPDPEFRQPELALKYALDAVELDPQPFILDTLAEAHWQNQQYGQAVAAAEKAFQQAEEDDRSRFEKRWKQFREKLSRLSAEEQE